MADMDMARRGFLSHATVAAVTHAIDESSATSLSVEERARVRSNILQTRWSVRARWKRLILLSAGAFAVGLAANAGDARADEGSPWNAHIPFDQYCVPCWMGNVGSATLCPCRIADPIIIKQ
jgi:hypothetical protein